MRGLTERIAGTRTAGQTREILLLCGHTLILYLKEGQDWRPCYCSYAGYGRNGLRKNRKEGDGTTPIGAFPLLFAFGIRKNPGTALPYRDVTPRSYWKEDGNCWVESDVPVTGEHLSSYDPQYRYAAAVGFNTDPYIPGLGSAIFLHVKNDQHWETAGCISVTEKNMIRLLSLLHPGAVLIAVSSPEELDAY